MSKYYVIRCLFRKLDRIDVKKIAHKSYFIDQNREDDHFYSIWPIHFNFI